MVHGVGYVGVVTVWELLRDDGCNIGNMYENEKQTLCSGTDIGLWTMGRMKYEDKGGMRMGLVKRMGAVMELCT